MTLKSFVKSFLNFYSNDHGADSMERTLADINGKTCNTYQSVSQAFIVSDTTIKPMLSVKSVPVKMAGDYCTYTVCECGHYSKGAYTDELPICAKCGRIVEKTEIGREEWDEFTEITSIVSFDGAPEILVCRNKINECYKTRPEHQDEVD